MPTPRLSACSPPSTTPTACGLLEIHSRAVAGLAKKVITGRQRSAAARGTDRWSTGVDQAGQVNVS
jgi:hypothetical protein